MTERNLRYAGAKPWAFVVCTDSFLSGWGKADGGRSLYALPVASEEEARIVLANARARSDMRRPRIVSRMRTRGGFWEPIVRLGAADHLSVPDREEASRWYERGGFLPDLP